MSDCASKMFLVQWQPEVWILHVVIKRLPISVLFVFEGTGIKITGFDKKINMC